MYAKQFISKHFWCNQIDCSCRRPRAFGYGSCTIRFCSTLLMYSHWKRSRTKKNAAVDSSRHSRASIAIASTDKKKPETNTNDSILFQLNVKYTHSITASSHCLVLDCQNGRPIRFGHRAKTAHSDKSIECQTKRIKQWHGKNNACEHNWFRFHLWPQSHYRKTIT